MAGDGDEGFEWQVEGGIGTVTFCRPASLNSLTFQTYAELERLAWACQTDDAERRSPRFTGR